MSQSATTAAISTATSDDFQRLLDQVARIEDRVSAPPPVQPMELRSFDELERWAKIAARSKMVPKGYINEPESIIIAVQMGAELGLRPMQSLQNIASINGRPSVWGDAMLALCMSHPLYAGVTEKITVEGDAREAVCIAKRKGDPEPKVGRFSVAEAKQAGLWNKEGPWRAYPQRMLQMRARGFALRDAFPDKLRGLISAEEAADYPVESAAPAAPALPDRDAINAAVPMPEPKKPSVADWLDKFERNLAQAPTLQDAEMIIARPVVGDAREKLTGSDLDRLEGIIAAARERFASADPAGETIAELEQLGDGT